MAQVVRQPCDEGVIRAKEATAACAPNAAPWVLTATILGSSMAFIDEMALPVALPAIKEAPGATAEDAHWVVAAYTLLLLASLVLISAALPIEGKKPKRNGEALAEEGVSSRPLDV